MEFMWKNKGICKSDWESTMTFNKCSITHNKMKNLYSGEELGVQSPRRCRKCPDCSDCRFSGLRHMEMKAMECRMIEDRVTHNPRKKCFDMDYVFINNPSKLSGNVGQIIKISEAVEKRLIKEGQVNDFNEIFEEFINQGMLRHITQMEMDQWRGPGQYVPICHV